MIDHDFIFIRHEPIFLLLSLLLPKKLKKFIVELNGFWDVSIGLKDIFLAL